MNFIPKLTRQRISELPEGTPIRIGSRVVVFDGCSIEPNYKGEDETFVYYIDTDGKRHRHFEWLYSSQAPNSLSQNCANTAPGSGVPRT